MEKEFNIIGWAEHCSSKRLHHIVHINKNLDYVLRNVGDGEYSLVSSNQISAFYDTGYYKKD